MPIPGDVNLWIQAHFAESEQVRAMTLLQGAVDHTGTPAAPRLVRCAALASRGSLEMLVYYVDLLKIDYRDVIAAGEYEPSGKGLVHVRDLNKPIL